jgi:nucleoside-diphosphate-sugar epimerase
MYYSKLLLIHKVDDLEGMHAMANPQNKQTNILIVGFGYLGKEIAKQLYTDINFNIWTLSRSKVENPYKANHIVADLTKPFQLLCLPNNVYFDFIIYTVSADNSTPSSYYDAYIFSLHNLLQKLRAKKKPPKKLFFISSTSVYHQNKGQWVNEYSTTNPLYFRGRYMLEAESLLKTSEFDTTIVRLGGIYGSNRQNIIDMVRKKSGYRNTPDVYSNRIHVEDAAGIIIHLIKQAEKNISINNLYLGVDCEPAPLYEITQWLGNKLDITLTTNKIPNTMHNKRCYNKLIIQSGYKFIYPNYKAGLSKILASS